MTARFVIRGRVQGVGFRFHCQSSAEALGVSGEVWNRRDGAVECIVTSDEPSRIDLFEEKLRNGPGYVNSIARHTEADREFFGFQIGSTR